MKQTKFTSPANTSSNISRKSLLVQLVKQWHTSFQSQKISLEECYENFIKRLCDSLKQVIRFDNSISKILAELSYEPDFMEFSKTKPNPLKATLEVVNSTLLQKKFISEKQCNKFKESFYTNTVEESIILLKTNLKSEGFLKRKTEESPEKKVQPKTSAAILSEKQHLIKLWNISMVVSHQNFWRFVLKEQIDNRELFVIMKNYEEILQEQTSRDFRKQVQAYLRMLLDKKKQSDIAPIRLVDTSIVQYDHLLDMKAQYISVYLNKTRWAKYTEQYEELTGFLTSRCNKKEIKFEAYGSFQSKFYVIDYSDIDIGLYYEGLYLQQRHKQIDLLFKIEEVMQRDRTMITNFSGCKVYSAPVIKIPFIKVFYKSYRINKKDLVPSIDIIINNKQGMQNSKLLSLYAQDEYILKFCNLIKYWAVNRTLINMKCKMEGMSSYGVVLMCLYYLMTSGQVPVLVKTKDGYDIGRDKFNVRYNFLENFIRFLKFYAYEYTEDEGSTVLRGQFHKEKRIVCLIETSDAKKVYDETLIINMYDFIDGTNPGRMKAHLYPKFKGIFQETIDCLESRSISFLSCVYPEEVQQDPSERPLLGRGNRFGYGVQRDRSQK